MIALDVETVARRLGALVSIAMHNDDVELIVGSHEPGARDVIRWALAQGIVGLHVASDIVAMWQVFPDLLPDILDAYEHDRIRDVGKREELIDIADGEHMRRGTYALAEVAYRRCGIDLAKGADTWRLRYGELLGVDVRDWPVDAKRYAIDDARTTWAVWREQESYRGRCVVDVLAPEHDLVRAEFGLYLSTTHGIHTDRAWVDRLDRRWSEQIEYLAAVCMRYGLARYKHKIKRPSPIVCSTKIAQGMIEQYAAARGIREHRTDPTASHSEGQAQLTDAALDHVGIHPGAFVDGHFVNEVRAELGTIEQAHPLEAYRQLKAIRSQRSKVVPPLRNPIIRTKYGMAETARTTSSGFADDDEWIGTNLQNQERDAEIRGCLVPPPGKLPDDVLAALRAHGRAP